MAKICQADRSKGQTCNNCKWHQLDADLSAKSGVMRFSCVALENKSKVVHWESKR